jgi:L-malate glycosyltransferase
MPDKKKVVAVHLYNDFSGSPKVFATALRTLIQNKFEVHIYTSNETPGALSNISGATIFPKRYAFKSNPLLRLFEFLRSQVVLFFALLKYNNRDTVFYINSVLPFGAALAGKIKGIKIIYHLHETSIKPVLLKKFLFGVVNNSASEVIYVSKFLSQQEPLSKPTSTVIYNSLDPAFIERANLEYVEDKHDFRVLMLCSLKDYKGVPQFFKLAPSIPNLQFDLVLNADKTSVEAYLKQNPPADNLHIHFNQRDVHRFYQNASLVLNLSHPDAWVETFGMTILEGMVYKLPAIVPKVGGVVELIDDGINGYRINVTAEEDLKARIIQLYSNKDLYQQLSKSAFEKAQFFAPNQFESGVLKVFI